MHRAWLLVIRARTLWITRSLHTSSGILDTMRHDLHNDFIQAIAQLAVARRSFSKLADGKLILGNDNHIGDIGEYWVRRYYEILGQFKCYGTGKNCAFDLKLDDGVGVSVKTLTAWSKSGYGTPVRTLDGKHWQVLAAVFLGEDLQPLKLAIVPLADLIKEPVFVDNLARRTHPTDPTKSYPRFEWWTWLDRYKVTFAMKEDDLGLPPVASVAAEQRM